MEESARGQPDRMSLGMTDASPGHSDRRWLTLRVAARATVFLVLTLAVGCGMESGELGQPLLGDSKAGVRPAPQASSASSVCR